MGNLLIRLAPFRSEGPNGYLLRLAEANKLQRTDLFDLGVDFSIDALARHHLLPDRRLDAALWGWVQGLAKLRQQKPRTWNTRCSRFCPVCLQEEASWRAEWELLFYDACTLHGVWMIDRCSSCGKAVSWKRSHVLRCDCGADLRAEFAQPAPAEVISLAMVLSNKLRRHATKDAPQPFCHLDVEQTQRLIRFLGVHLDPAGMPKIAKLNNAARMETSWPVTSVAAAILSDWPRAFHARFSEVQAHSKGLKIGLSGLFERAYRYLYRGLKESAFDAVRYAFELWLIENWEGGLALRNRRLTAPILGHVNWIPAKVAAEQLGVGTNRIRQLISNGDIDGNESYSETGRRFLMVRKEQIDKLTYIDLNEANMSTAMELLGLTKVRMRELLRLLFPSAYRAASEHGGFPPWRIRRQDIERYLQIGYDLPILTVAEESQVSLFHVLKYWAWTADEIVDLIEDVRDKGIPLEGMLEGGVGLARWLFDCQSLRIWRQRRTPELANWFSIPQVAKLLGLKQEVAYWLVRNEFIHAEKLRTLRGCGARVSRVELTRFKESYVFASELAERLETSSRKVNALLTEQGIKPASGKEPEKCGKIFFARSRDLTDLLSTLKISLR